MRPQHQSKHRYGSCLYPPLKLIKSNEQLLKLNFSQWVLLFLAPFMKYSLVSCSVSGNVYTGGHMVPVEAICPPEWAHSTFGQSVVPSVTCTGKVILEPSFFQTVVRQLRTAQNDNLCLKQNSDSKGDSKGKKAANKPLKILEEDDEDLSALKDPSEKVSRTLTSLKHCPVKH